MTLLKDIARIEKGRKYNLLEEKEEGAIRVFQANDFRNENKHLYTLDKDGVLAHEDDIMLVWDGSVGQMGFGRSGYVGSTMVKLEVKNKKQFSPFFIFRFLQTKSEYLKRKATGATIMHINRKSLEQIKIPEFCLADQLRIAKLLSKTENLINQRKESIRLLDEFLKSTFFKMFGDPVRNDKRWKVCLLNELGSLDRGVSKARPRNSPELLGGIYPLIQTGDVTNSGIYITSYKQTYSELGLKQSKLWPKGTMLITIAANIAQTSILSLEACFPDSVVGFVTNTRKARVLYVHFLFKFFQTLLESKASQTAQKNINLDILRNLKVPCPPLKLQSQFAQIVEKIESQKTQYQQSLQELENLYGSLSQKAFKGELSLEEDSLLVANESVVNYSK